MTRVAVLGTGRMGGAIAHRLVASGFDLQVWDRTAAKASALNVGRVAQTPAEARRRYRYQQPDQCCGGARCLPRAAGGLRYLHYGLVRRDEHGRPGEHRRAQPRGADPRAPFTRGAGPRQCPRSRERNAGSARRRLARRSRGSAAGPRTARRDPPRRRVRKRRAPEAGREHDARHHECRGGGATCSGYGRGS